MTVACNVSEKPSIDTKRCFRCKADKNVEREFYPSRNGKIPSWCRECFKSYRRARSPLTRETEARKRRVYRQVNREKILASGRARYHANKLKTAPAARRRAREWYYSNREKAILARRNYYSNNRKSFLWNCALYRKSNADKISKFQMAYRESHREERKKYDRNRLLNDREKFLGYAAKRRALKAGAPVNDLTAAQWGAIKKLYGNLCVYCGESKPLTQDHVIPLSKGGSHTASNVVPACRSCNCKKGARPAPKMVVNV